MKGNEKIIERLNDLLSDELTAVNQYMVHSEMCDNWKYEKLAKIAEARAIDEMKHAEKLIGRILFLDAIPIVSNYKKIHIGAEIKVQFENDLEAEVGAVDGYNKAIKVSVEEGDNGTRSLLESILKDEEDHVDMLEAQITQVEMMGIKSFLAEQTD